MQDENSGITHLVITRTDDFVSSEAEYFEVRCVNRTGALTRVSAAISLDARAVTVGGG